MRSIKPYEVLTKQIEDGTVVVYHSGKRKYILDYYSSLSSQYNKSFVSLGTRLIVMTDSKNKFLQTSFTTGLCLALKNIKVGLLKYANKKEIEVYRNIQRAYNEDV